MKKLTSTLFIALSAQSFFINSEAGKNSSSLRYQEVSNDLLVNNDEDKSNNNDQEAFDAPSINNSKYKIINDDKILLWRKKYFLEKRFLSCVKPAEDKLKEVTQTLNQMLQSDEAAEITLRFLKETGYSDPYLSQTNEQSIVSSTVILYSRKNKYSGRTESAIEKEKLGTYLFGLPNRPHSHTKQEEYNDHLLLLLEQRQKILTIFTEEPKDSPTLIGE